VSFCFFLLFRHNGTRTVRDTEYGIRDTLRCKYGRQDRATDLTGENRWKKQKKEEKKERERSELSFFPSRVVSLRASLGFIPGPGERHEAYSSGTWDGG